MKRSVVCTLLLALLYLIPQAQIGVFQKVISDSVFSKDYRFRSLPNYSLYNGITNIISPTTGTYDLTTPPGTTAQRPVVPASKYILRYNTDSAALEIGNPSQVWKTLGMSSVQTFDTSAITNFGLKVRSLFSATSPLLYNAVTGNLQIPQATSSTAGYLASADWVTFNAKLPDPGSNGIVVRTALGTTASRQLVAASTNISLVNATGVSGNPSIDVNDTLLLRQLQLPYIPTALASADSALFLNRSTGFLEVRALAAAGTGTFNKAGGGISYTGDSLYLNQSFTRNLFSVTAPLTYNSSTGVFGVDTSTNGTGLATIHKLNLVNNGLSRNSDTTQFGQIVGASGNPAALTHNTEIPLNGFNTVFTGTGGLGIGTSTVGNRKLNIAATSTTQGINITTVDGTGINTVASGTANALFAQTGGTGTAITGSSSGTSGYGVLAVASGTSGIPFKANIFSSSTNSATPVVAEFTRNVFGVPADGVGLSIMFRGQTTNTTDIETGQIRNYLSTALHASRSSAFEFHLVNNAISARKALLASTGQWTWDGYPALTAQTDTTTYKPVAIDGSGNVAKMAGWAGGATAPGMPENAVQYRKSDGTFGGDSLFFYPALNQILNVRNYLQYGRPVRGFWQDSAAGSSGGYVWKVYPRGSAGAGADSLQFWYQRVETNKYDAAWPENAVFTLLGAGDIGGFSPFASIRLEQNFYDDWEYHAFTTKPRSIANTEIRHWSWNVSRTTGYALLQTRSAQNVWKYSDITNPMNDQPYLDLNPQGLKLYTWVGAEAGISSTHGINPTNQIGFAITNDTGAFAVKFQPSALAQSLVLGTGINILNPATTGGYIGIKKDIRSDGHEIRTENLPNSVVGLSVLSTAIGYVHHIDIDGSGYAVVHTIGSHNINRDPGISTSTRMLSVYNNYNPNDSIFHVRGNGDLYTKGMITANADSTTSATGGFVYRDAITGNFRITASPGGAATTLYSGDGTLLSDRTVTGSSNSLTYNGIFNYRVNGNAFILDKTTPTAPYSMAVIGSPNQLLIGFTPVATVYSKGSGIAIDTNNNVGLGTTPATTLPLYSTGLSTAVLGFQSTSSNFYQVENINSSVTANLQDYYFRIDATSGNITITLPAASTAFGSSVGIHYVFKRIDNSGNTVSVVRAGSDTIDGATSISLTTQYEVKELQCSSTSTWDIK